jgi:hypothetical protein
MYHSIQSTKQKHESFHIVYQTASLYHHIQNHSIVMNLSIQDRLHSNNQTLPQRTGSIRFQFCSASVPRSIESLLTFLPPPTHHTKMEESSILLEWVVGCHVLYVCYGAVKARTKRRLQQKGNRRNKLKTIRSAWLSVSVIACNIYPRSVVNRMTCVACKQHRRC